MNIGRIGIVGGGGWLGSALVASLLRANLVAPENLTCSHRSALPASKPDCRWTRDNAELVDASDVIILSVRPGDWPAVEIAAPDKLVISVMAGVSVADIRSRTRSRRIARALPNAAAEVGFSYTPVFVESEVAADAAVVASIFRSCGEVDVVDREQDIDYFTALSGSGEAFPALLAEAMMADAIRRGISSAMAIRAVQQLLIGTGRLQAAHRRSPVDVVQAFVDYKGTTAAGINAMRATGFAESVGAGLEAAFRKAIELPRSHTA
jgi:pyrroline-5-carboxylate reductase